MKFLTKIYNGVQNALVWLAVQRTRHIKESNFVLILALVTGILSGFASMLLKWLIEMIEERVNEHIIITEDNFLYLITPILGVLICLLYVRYIVRDSISHGVTRVLFALSQRKSRIKLHNSFSSIVASAMTIGFGGSVGAEGPIVHTGAAIGSNLGSWFRMPPRVMMVLVGCGAAAGIAGIFKAPIAGLLFTVEVLMIDLTAVSVTPLMIASVTAATIAYINTGDDVQFFFSQSEKFYANRIPFVIIFGVFCGLVSLYFTKTINFMETMLGRLKNVWVKFAVGATLLSLLIYIFPPLYGEGYMGIGLLLDGKYKELLDGSLFYIFKDNEFVVMAFIGCIVLMKVFATSATTGAGGVGGTFAPSLFVGCFAGFFFAMLLNMLDVGIEFSSKNFALLGMAGVMAGVMHAPLMGIFLTAEMTGGYELFLPLLIVSVISYGTIKLFLPYSIYTMRLAQRGELLTHHKDKAVLTLLKMDSVIETDFLSVTPNMSLKEMVGVVSQSSRNLFPVVDEQQQLVGVVILDDIRNIMFRPDLYRKLYVKKFMNVPSAKIEVGTSMETVMKLFDQTGAWNLPVVENGRYVGFVSKSKIFNSYRRVLRHYSED